MRYLCPLTLIIEYFILKAVSEYSKENIYYLPNLDLLILILLKLKTACKQSVQRVQSLLL